MAATTPITPEQTQLIIAQMDDPTISRTALARKAGVCISTLYRVIRENGGKLNHHLCTKQEGVEDMIREYYPHYTASEIEQMKPHGIAITKSRILTWAKQLGVVHTSEVWAKVGEKHRRLYRMEQWRVMSGMKQQTKLRIGALPVKHYRAQWHLENKHGYILTTDRNLIWYDDDTHRINESHYTQKYGFRFERIAE